MSFKFIPYALKPVTFSMNPLLSTSTKIIAEECEIMEDSKECETLWIAIYRNFMEAIDAIDNGINQYDFESLLKGPLIFR